MSIENILYFALGLLIAGLLALAVMPAVWRRAVRLTTRRIEAATPITMAEFRADKDQLRAEFALSTRRLEMNVEALRRRLSEQLRDVSRRRTEVGAIKGERESYLQQIRELEEREAELRRRILDLEKEGADLAQRLRMRDREFADKSAQLETTREALRGKTPRTAYLDGRPLSGDYNRDLEEVLQHLESERKRVSFLESQNRSLIAQAETTNQRTAEATSAAVDLRAALAREEEAATEAQTALVDAEIRAAEAESRVSATLADTTRAIEAADDERIRARAEKATIEDELERLRAKVQTVEATIMADWDSDRVEQAHLREKLNDIAAEVSRLVHAVEGDAPEEVEETLLARVQKYSDEDLSGPPTQREPAVAGAVSDRLSALRDIQRASP